MTRVARSRPAVVSPALYRHFAVITVSLTACIAMFADGENRDAMANSVHSQRQGRLVLSAETSGQKRVKIVGKGVTFRDGRWGNGGGRSSRHGKSAAWSGDERFDDDIGESTDGESATGGVGPSGMTGGRMPPPPQVNEAVGPRSGGNVTKTKHKPTEEELEQIEEESLKRSGASDSSDF